MAFKGIYLPKFYKFFLVGLEENGLDDKLLIIVLELKLQQDKLTINGSSLIGNQLYLTNVKQLEEVSTICNKKQLERATTRISGVAWLGGLKPIGAQTYGLFKIYGGCNTIFSGKEIIS